MATNRDVRIGTHGLEGTLAIPDGAMGLVVFAHGSGSSRHSPRNTYVAEQLQANGLATLLFDLLTESEGQDRRQVFNIPLLGERVVEALDWLDSNTDLARMNLGLFGASTGAAAALVAAAQRPERVGAVVSRGGRADLAETHLRRVRCPTLLIVGGGDEAVIDLNRAAMGQMICEKRLEIVAGATHLFEEPGKLDAVVRLATDWFQRTLTPAPGT